MDYSISESFVTSKEKFIYESTIENLKKFRKELSQERIENPIIRNSNDNRSYAKKMLQEYRNKKSILDISKNSVLIEKENNNPEYYPKHQEEYSKKATKGKVNLFFKDKRNGSLSQNQSTTNMVFDLFDIKNIRSLRPKDPSQANLQISNSQVNVESTNLNKDSHRMKTARASSPVYIKNTQNKEANVEKMKTKMSDYFSKPYDRILKIRNKNLADVSKFKENLKRSISNSEIDSSMFQRLRSSSNIRYKEIYEIKKQFRKEDLSQGKGEKGIDSVKGKSKIKEILSKKLRRSEILKIQGFS